MDKQALKAKLLEILSKHVGAANAIGMGELYEMLFGEPWKSRINDTSALRSLIRALRESGVPIGSNGFGYYILRSDSEIAEYCRRMEHRALGTLKRISRIKKISLPAYLGQLQLGLQKDAGTR